MKKKVKDNDYTFWVCVILAVIGAVICYRATDQHTVRYSAYGTFVLCAFCAGYCISFMQEEKNKWYLIPIALFIAGTVIHIWITI
ncbi:MAG: hypothetical protein WCW61_04760 [Patescibacteria group bacterium]|jgi:hypothetical protein